MRTGRSAAARSFITVTDRSNEECQSGKNKRDSQDSITVSNRRHATGGDSDRSRDDWFIQEISDEAIMRKTEAKHVPSDLQDPLYLDR
jgi:hypothetical protein